MQHEPKNKVSDAMPPNVRTKDKLAPVWEAIWQMKEHGFSSPIADRKHIAHQAVANNLSFDRVNI